MARPENHEHDHGHDHGHGRLPGLRVFYLQIPLGSAICPSRALLNCRAASRRIRLFLGSDHAAAAHVAPLLTSWSHRPTVGAEERTSSPIFVYSDDGPRHQRHPQPVTRCPSPPGEGVSREIHQRAARGAGRVVEAAAAL